MADQLPPKDDAAGRDERAAKFREELAQKLPEITGFLEQLRDDYEALAEIPLHARQNFLMAAGQVARPGPWAKRALSRAAHDRREASRRKDDNAVLDQTGIRQSRRQSIFTPWQHGATIDRLKVGTVREKVTANAIVHDAETAVPVAMLAVDHSPDTAGRLHDAKHCYICKADYQRVHFFYDALCPDCAERNWSKRKPQADLSGRVALVTGSRVKIGFHAALMLLRSGCHVVVTTRFPRDAARRYGAEKDFADWSDRLEVFGLDLRHTPSVEAFTKFLLGHLPRLDFIINNACQTVRRPAGFYDHLLNDEQIALGEAPEAVRQLTAAYESMRGGSAGEATSGSLVTAAHAIGLNDPASLSQLALLEEDLDRSTHLFPAGQLDADEQQVDLREINSWRLPLADVTAVELLEVQLVNAVAPFILNARLKPLMLKAGNNDAHIVNVSAVEGQFARRLKTDRHPHTNMAKAALNMMTRTSAADYVRSGIHMNSVDTGWVTDEDPAQLAAKKTREQGFHPPLDIVDGAARIVDPIFVGINTGKHMWGAFLKDYVPIDW